MRYKVMRISPVQSAKVMGTISLFAAMPFFVIFILSTMIIPFTAKESGHEIHIDPMFYMMMIMFPVFYCFVSAVMGAVIAAIYNFTCKFTGGLEVDLAAIPEKDLTDFDK